MKLRQIRESMNLTQQELADKAGVSRWTISQIERWTGRPDSKKRVAKHEVMESLAGALQVQVNEVEEFTRMKDFKIERFEKELEASRNKETPQ